MLSIRLEGTCLKMDEQWVRLVGKAIKAAEELAAYSGAKVIVEAEVGEDIKEDMGVGAKSDKVEITSVEEIYLCPGCGEVTSGKVRVDEEKKRWHLHCYRAVHGG